MVSPPGPDSGRTSPSDIDQDADVRMFWERATELFCVTDSAGRFIRVNPAWTRVLGWREDELVGRLVTEFVHPDDIPRTNAPVVEESMGGHRLQEMQNRYRHRDGSLRWLRWNGYERDGRWYGIARDVTATHTSHDALRASEQRSRAVLGALQEGLIVVDRNLRIREANDRFAEMVGLPTDEIVGLTPPYPWWPTDDPAEQAEALRAGMEDLPTTAEVELRHSSGRRIPVLVDSVELPQRGRDNALLAVLRDITPLVAARDRLIHAHIAAGLSSWEWHAATDIVTVHASAFGLDPEGYEIDSETSMAGVIPEHRETLRQARRDILEGRTDSFALDVRLGDGAQVEWMELRGHALRDEDGAIVGIRGSAQDISARKRAEHEAALLHELAHGVVAVDADLRVTYVSAPAATLLGVPREDAIGRPVTELIPGGGTRLPRPDGDPGTRLVELDLDGPPPGRLSIVISPA